MAVVTISRQFGAGGRTLGEAVAEKLKYKFVSQSVVNKMAKEANVSVDWITSVEKEAGGWLMRFLSGLVSSDFIERQIGDSAADFDETKYVTFLTQLVHSIADQGKVVILGRGSQFILSDYPGAVNVLLVADMKDRVSFLSKIWEVSEKEAQSSIISSQKRRNAFLKHFDPRNPDDTSLYHLVINISRIPLEQAEDIIVELVKNEEARAEKEG